MTLLVHGRGHSNLRHGLNLESRSNLGSVTLNVTTPTSYWLRTDDVILADDGTFTSS